MTRPRALALAWLALWAGLSTAPASAAERCAEWAEVAGLAAEDRGIGGTGLSDEDRGIGGTGLYGTITGFGSVCVNGVRVHTDATESVEINGEPATTDDLALGQVVWIKASARGGRLDAEHIAALSAVVGLVSEVAPDGTALEVGDVPVVVGPEAIVVGDLAAGDLVDVSGLARGDGRVEASRIVRLEAGTAFESPALSELLRVAPQVRTLSVEGYANPLAASDLVELSGIEVDVSGMAARLEADRRAWALGDIVGERRIRAHRLEHRGWEEPVVPLPVAPPEPVPGPPLGASDRPDLFGASRAGAARVVPVSPAVPSLPSAPVVQTPERGTTELPASDVPVPTLAPTPVPLPPTRVPIKPPPPAPTDRVLVPTTVAPARDLAPARR